MLSCKRKNITVPEGYIFCEDFTGKALDRPEYGKIRELVRNRKIQILIIYATDRFARKVGVGDILLDELFQYGVQLHIVVWDSYVRDVPEDRLRFNFEMTFSDFERSKIVERTTRGKIKKLQEGYVIGCTRAPYGYELIGSRKHAKLAIVEEQAAIVREIFQMYAYERLGTVLIARKLELRGTPSPGDLRARDWDLPVLKKCAIGLVGTLAAYMKFSIERPIPSVCHVRPQDNGVRRNSPYYR